MGRRLAPAYNGFVTHAMAAAESVWYVYGVLPAEKALSDGDAPRGLEDAAVALEPKGSLAALISTLSRGTYDSSVLETHTADVDWVGPRAVAHDRVLTWASDRWNGAVVPFPMFSIFSSRGAVEKMLADRGEELGTALDRARRGREYALRVYRVDAEMLAAMASLSPRLRELAAEAEGAKPGQRYLLERKLEGEKKSEMRRVSAELVDEIVNGLTPHSVAVERSPIPRDAATREPARGQMVLNASFQVAPPKFAEFQATMSELVHQHTAHGLRFDFTGPWPPYHFVRDANAETSRG